MKPNIPVDQFRKHIQSQYIKKFKVVRDVTPTDCTWLSETVKEGTIVFKYIGATYGCVGPNGSAFTLVDGETPFF
jgi:hypothetical protein